MLFVPNPGEDALMKSLVTTSLLLPASLIFACSSSKDGTTLDLSTDPSMSVAVGEEGTGVHVNAVTEARPASTT